MESEIELKDPPEELVQFIINCPSFIIAGHKEPDGDCVGSQLALRSALLRLGKEAVVCSAGPFTRTELREYTQQFITVSKSEEDINTKVIVIDCSGTDRTGDIQSFLEKFPCAIIDHHARFIIRLPPKKNLFMLTLTHLLLHYLFIN